MQRFRAELAEFDFEQPQPLEEALRWAIERLEQGIVQMSNPRYFGLFNPGANFPAQCADRLAGSFNPQLASSASSPVPVALESHVIRAVARRAAFGDDATGHFATGGSEANYTALICALTAAHPALFRRRRARLCRTREILYIARLPHRVAENCASSGRRPQRAAAGGYGRPRPHGPQGAAASHCR